MSRARTPFSLARVLAALVGLASAPASGGTFNFAGELTLVVGDPYYFGGTFRVSGSGVGTSSPSRVTIPDGAFAARLQNQTETPGLTAVNVVSGENAAGSFSGPSLRGTMPFLGRLMHGNPVPPDDFGAFRSLPLTPVGAGGHATAIPPEPLVWRILGAPWTVGNVFLYSGLKFTPGGDVVIVPISVTGFDGRTALGAGALQLVTPIVVTSTLGTGDPEIFHGHGRLTVTFSPAVPEPSRALAFAAALALAFYRLAARPRGAGVGNAAAGITRG